MSFLDLCRRRYSLRRYSPREVPREVIDRCLEAARLAPSACNSQPWTFLVADRDPLRRELGERAFSGPYAIFRFAREAAALIAVVRERSAYVAAMAGSFRGVQYSLIDIGIACEHLVLQAAEEGVGTCWIGWFNEKAVKQVLGLPREAKVDVLIAMGYPPDDAQPRERNRKNLEEIRRYVTDGG